MNRADQRMVWLLRRLATEWMHPQGFTVAWNEETVDAFVKSFPEAERTLHIYTMGPNSSPMLNRAAQRAFKRGYLKAGRVGNQDARSYNQRTWCRTWNITPEGREFLRQTDARKTASRFAGWWE